jgi:cytochrome c biogenesis protein CcdA/glutaredoxin
MKVKFLLPLLILSFFLCLSLVFSSDKVEIYFFWGQGCPHCAKEKPFLEKLKQKYPQLDVKEFEVYYSTENQELFKKVAEAYNTEVNGVPTTFIGRDFIVGFGSEETTGKKIEDLIQKCLENGCPSPGEIVEAGGINKQDENRQKQEGNTTLQNINSQKESKNSFYVFGKEFKISSESPIFIYGAILGLIDGINPCMFSVLLFLLSYLLAVGSEKRALKVGLVFVMGVFIIYSLFMVGMLSLINFIGIIKKVKIIVSFLALIFGAIMIKDFFAYGKGISLEIPKRVKPTIERLIKVGTIPSALILSLLSSLVELPCTAGIPLVYTTLVSEKSGNLFYILWYNLFFVVPLLIIIALVHFAYVKAEKVEKWRLKFRRYMRLVAGTILLILALSLFFGWL